jgi:phosphoribosylformylglycinamidine synthase
MVLGGGAPVYEREYTTPSYFAQRDAFDANSIPVPSDLKAVAHQLNTLPNIASKRWIFNQYDSMVGTANASTNAPTDAAVVWVRGTEKKGIAMTVDCNSRYVHADPYQGGLIAVCEAARNIVCTGAVPAAITNCLNFGNPYNPEVYYQFVYALKGMSDACRKLDTPVTGGNVSFYNQSPEGPVYPTPTIGMVGMLEDVSKHMTLDFKQAGDVIYMVGQSRNDIGSSEYLHKVCGVDLSPAPYMDLNEEFTVQQAVLKLIQANLIQSAHDIAEGGLFINLLESGFHRQLGFSIETPAGIRADAYLFGEAQSRIVVSVKPENITAFEQALANTPYEKVGTVTTGDIHVLGEAWGVATEWQHSYDTAIENMLKA